MTAPPPRALPPIWRQRNFMLLWSGQVVSSLGSGMTAFAIGTATGIVIMCSA